MTEILVAYVACANRDEARRIGRALVEERLAACIHLRPHQAIFRWQGVVEEAEEVGLLAKTTRAAWPALQARVRALHGYELPCIVAWTLAEGLPDFLDWVAASVGPDPIEPGSG